MGKRLVDPRAGLDAVAKGKLGETIYMKKQLENLKWTEHSEDLSVDEE
jgi:hypothetical protein